MTGVQTCALPIFNDLPAAANVKFVASYRAKYHRAPSFYGAQAYDAAWRRPLAPILDPTHRPVRRNAKLDDSAGRGPRVKAIPKRIVAPPRV